MDDGLVGQHDPAPGGRLTVDAERLVAGGAALAHAGDGRVVFVAGALPGERTTAVVERVRRDVVFATVEEIHRPSPQRRRPACQHRLDGCGGCRWMHLADDAQHDAKVGVVCDALRRIGRLDTARIDRLVSFAGAVAATGYRTTARVHGTGNGVGFVAEPASGATVVSTPSCLVAHPGLRELIARCVAPIGVELTLRTSVATAAATAEVHTPTRGARPGDRSARRGTARRPRGRTATHPGDRRRRRSASDGGVTLPDHVAKGADALLVEHVGDVALQVSAGSFFQSGPEAASLLAATVVEALPEAGDDHVVAADLYAGVGLFGATALAGAVHLVAVETSAAAADARVNLAGLPAQVVRSEVARWQPDRSFDVVVADPARSGLGRPGVATVVATDTPVLVLVSCDPASLARDMVLLADAGFVPESVSVLDVFPQTPHVEMVTRFVRAGARRVGT